MSTETKTIGSDGIQEAAERAAKDTILADDETVGTSRLVTALN